MALAQKRVTLANGIELDVVDEGPREGETLIFLHGFPESHRTWRHQIPHLSDRYRCIAPDQRGYRGSSRPADIDAYTPDKLIGDVFLLADALGVGKFTVVGHDWGGAIAWGVAIGGQGARVERAIIANAPHPVIFQKLLYTNQVQRQASQYMRAFRDAGHDPFIREHGLAEFLRREAEWESASAMEPEERAAQLQDWSDPETGIAMLNWYRASQIDVPPMDAPFDVPEGFAPPTLPDLDIPTLVIWALDDMALPPENLEGLDQVIKDLTVVKVPDCGHFVPWEAPEKVNAAIGDFLHRNGV